MIAVVLIIFLIVGLTRTRSAERRRKAEAAQAAVRRARWESASDSERAAIVATVKAAQQKAVERRAAFWSAVKWVSIIIITGVVVFIAVVTLLDAWKWVCFCASVGCLLWALHSIISSAVADGVRRGREQ